MQFPGTAVVSGGRHFPSGDCLYSGRIYGNTWAGSYRRRTGAGRSDFLDVYKRQYLVQTFSRIDASQIVSEFKQWSEDKAARFSEDEIKKYMECLEQTGVIERDITGSYCISEYRCV